MEYLKSFPCLVLASLLSSLLGCGGSYQNSQSSTTNQGSGTGSGTVAVPASTFNLTTDFTQASFPANTSTITTYLHRASTVNSVDADWTQPCAVNESETDLNKKYITCNLEVSELDLWYNSFNLNWGAAKGMCPYVQVTPFWFFDYKADLAQVASGANISVTTQDGGPPAFDAVAGGNGAGAAVIRGGAVTCTWDYTTQGGPNCCEGQYTLTTTACSSGTCTATTTLNSWGGKYGNCAAGPATALTWNQRDTSHNFPIGRTYVGISGAAQALQIGAPSINVTNNILNAVLYVANYTLNAAPSALTDVSLVQPEIGPNYTFICFDQGKEAIAWINLKVRKWNTAAELAKQQNGNPTLSGLETPFPGSQFDFYGFDDMVTILSKQYPFP